MFSAYVAPSVAGYVKKIKGQLKNNGFNGELLFLQSNGGTATPDIVIENPATLLLSGPAAGPSLACALGSAHDWSNVLSVDMGGTSFDVGVVNEGVIDIVEQQIIDAKMYCLPSVDISAIGAGGGSIAYVDPTGRLQVGPMSAGAMPGPACYGLGGEEPTVTDADLVLGYLDPDYFLAGESKLRMDLAEKAIKEKIADPLNISVRQAAAAIYEIINARMADGTNVNFVKRGYDPRDFTLCAAGGAAPVHAVQIMTELGIKKLIIPKVAPTYCAYGMLFSDFKHDFAAAYYSETDKADFGTINAQYEIME
jgi:N-methylhydantoinase A